MSSESNMRVNMIMASALNAAKQVIIDTLVHEIKEADTKELKDALYKKSIDVHMCNLSLTKNSDLTFNNNARRQNNNHTHNPYEINNTNYTRNITPKPFKTPENPVKIRGTNLLLQVMTEPVYKQFSILIARKLGYADNFSDAKFYVVGPKSENMYTALRIMYQNNDLSQDELDELVKEAHKSVEDADKA